MDLTRAGLLAVQRQPVVVVDRGLSTLNVVTNVREDPAVFPDVADEDVADHDRRELRLPEPGGVVQPPVLLRDCGFISLF